MTKEQIRKAIFGKLRTLQKNLAAQGIPCNYSRSVLSQDDGEFGFKITCEVSDNVNSTILPKVSIRTGRVVEEFDGTNFDQGLTRLKAAFLTEGDG